MKRKIDLQQGVRYKGYGYINEFGEFEFTPEQKGIRQGWQRLVKQGDGWTVNETKNSIIFHINIVRNGSPLSRMREFFEKVNKISEIITNYEF
ncbi:MAG: hypothetical protein LIR46_11505 [Bacteroidota bacterium]|nr:hypothetical protein [Bacteroidota bacterium]